MDNSYVFCSIIIYLWCSPCIHPVVAYNLTIVREFVTLVSMTLTMQQPIYSWPWPFSKSLLHTSTKQMIQWPFISYMVDLRYYRELWFCHTRTCKVWYLFFIAFTRKMIIQQKVSLVWGWPRLTLILWWSFVILTYSSYASYLCLI